MPPWGTVCAVGDMKWAVRLTQPRQSWPALSGCAEVASQHTHNSSWIFFNAPLFSCTLLRTSQLSHFHMKGLLSGAFHPPRPLCTGLYREYFVSLPLPLSAQAAFTAPSAPYEPWSSSVFLKFTPWRDFVLIITELKFPALRNFMSL